jgi:hypothetical protein
MGSTAGGLLATYNSWEPLENQTDVVVPVFALEAASAATVAVMGPVIAFGARSARRAEGGKGSLPALITGGVLYLGSGGLYFLSFIDLFEEDLPNTNMLWVPPAAAGVGALSLVFLSIDALVSHENAIELKQGAPINKPEKPRRVWTWVAYGVGGAAAVGAAITGALALKAHRTMEDLGRIEESCINMNEGFDEVECTDRSDLQKVKGLAGGTDILIGVAATGVAMGTALFFLEPRLRSARLDPNVSLAPWAVPGGAGIALGGSF